MLQGPVKIYPALHNIVKGPNKEYRIYAVPDPKLRDNTELEQNLTRPRHTIQIWFNISSQLEPRKFTNVYYNSLKKQQQKPP